MIIYSSNKLLSDVALYCAEKLFVDLYSVKIIISECCLKHDNAMGWTYDLFEDEIDIEIDKNLSNDKKILTMCHEMVHVRQAARGDEAFCEIEANKLEGVLYDEFRLIQTTNR
jgi:hypothetical protein